MLSCDPRAGFLLCLPRALSVPATQNNRKGRRGVHTIPCCRPPGPLPSSPFEYMAPKNPKGGRSAIIIGASSGIGEALAKRMARAGYRVALVARREAELQRVAEAINRRDRKLATIYPHDVTKFEEAPKLFQQIVHDLGGFDTIVYCSGVMPPVAKNEYSFQKDQQVFAVNVLGAMAWLNEAATRCERQESGTIAALGSVAGDRGRKGQPVYCASKAALASRFGDDDWCGCGATFHQMSFPRNSHDGTQRIAVMIGHQMMGT